MSTRQERPFADGGAEGDAARGRGRSRKAAAGVLEGKVKVHDPFELVRWLALSQPDPRKALAELVQNSLDARAGRIRVLRERRRRQARLRIVDDGEGVIPELDRPEALRSIATNIGHSRKRRLSPQERYQLMTQGQYGIGLLGFWSLGERLEIRSAVPGQRPHRLILLRDRPEYRIEPLRWGGSRDDERWTEVVVEDLRPEALRALLARRAADYLASELRGQLLDRDVDLLVEDKIARGRAPKLVVVRPVRYPGEAWDGPTRLPVDGYPPIRLEIHLVDEDEEAPPLAVFGAGTRVADSFRELSALDLDHPPWTDSRLTGHVDFPSFSIAPGSRRGILVDPAAEAFRTTLVSLEARLLESLVRRERRQQEELDQRLVKDLRRAFRGLFQRESRYTLLPVREPGGDAAIPTLVDDDGPKAGDAVVAIGAMETVDPAEPLLPPEVNGNGLDESVDPEPPPVPPGPLAGIEVSPSPIRLAFDTARRIRARGVDADGRPLREPVDYLFRVLGQGAELADEGGGRVLLRAGDEPAEAGLSVLAATVDSEARVVVPIVVRPPTEGGRGDEGIPSPELVDVPGAEWRSRLRDERWQVNTAHPEYRAVRETSHLKVRYLAMLFAKEVVLRSLQDPRLEKPLEQLVEVAAYADRNLSPSYRGR